jgi:SulP family sulfate permease
VPVAALAGVLLVTAWRMNEWHAIRFFFSKRLKHAIVAFLATLLATVLLDLTQAILIGFGVSTLLFMAQISDLHISRQAIDAGSSGRGEGDRPGPRRIAVYHLSGPLFFAAARKLVEEIEAQDAPDATLVLALRGVPLVDATGIDVLREIRRRQQDGGGEVLLASLAPRVEALLERTGFLARLGAGRVFASADRAVRSLGAALPEEAPHRLEAEGMDSTLVITPHEDRAGGGM